VLFEVIYAVWIGALVGVVLKLASPHPNLGSWLVAGLVGGFGGMCGLYFARMLGVSRELQGHTLAIAGGVAAMAITIYAAVSRAVTRRTEKREGRPSRPSIAF
jgi:hypothetical protein